MNTNQVLRESEPKTVTEALESAVVLTDPVPDKVIRDAFELDVEIANAQIDGRDYLILSDDLMTRRCKSKICNSITVGQPGVRLYRDGTKGGLDDLEDMSAESHYTHTMMTRPREQKKRR